MSAIYILWLRQVKRYFRSKARILTTLAQPLLFLFGIGFGFGPTYQKAGNGNYIQFLAPGIIAMAILFNAVFSGIEIIWDRQFGFLKETLVAPVTRLEIMLGRSLGGATVAMIQGCIMFVVCLCIGFRVSNFGALPQAFVFMFLIALLFTAIGTSIGSVIEDMSVFPMIMNFLVMPLFFLSGALFPLKGVAGPLEVLARFDPVSYGVDGLRGTLTGYVNFGMGLDFVVLSVVTAALLAVGSHLFSKIQV